MSDTYTNVQSDAQRSLVINRAWIVARVEHNTLFALVGPLGFCKLFVPDIIAGLQKKELQKL